MTRGTTGLPDDPPAEGSSGPDASLSPVTPDSTTGERLVALLLAGIIAWTYPVLFLFGTDVRAFGIPLLYLYLYLSWGLFVGIVALIIEWREVQASPPPHERNTEG